MGRASRTDETRTRESRTNETRTRASRTDEPRVKQETAAAMDTRQAAKLTRTGKQADMCKQDKDGDKPNGPDRDKRTS